MRQNCSGSAPALDDASTVVTDACVTSQLEVESMNTNSSAVERHCTCFINSLARATDHGCCWLMHSSAPDQQHNKLVSAVADGPCAARPNQLAG